MKRKVIAIRVSAQEAEALAVWTDCFNTTPSELIRNWLEDVLTWLDGGVLEVDLKRHLQLKEKP